MMALFDYALYNGCMSLYSREYTVTSSLCVYLVTYGKSE
jgi:hypothetical protein